MEETLLSDERLGANEAQPSRNDDNRSSKDDEIAVATNDSDDTTTESHQSPGDKTVDPQQEEGIAMETKASVAATEGEKEDVIHPDAAKVVATDESAVTTESHQSPGDKTVDLMKEGTLATTEASEETTEGEKEDDIPDDEVNKDEADIHVALNKEEVSLLEGSGGTEEKPQEDSMPTEQSDMVPSVPLCEDLIKQESGEDTASKREDHTAADVAEAMIIASPKSVTVKKLRRKDESSSSSSSSRRARTKHERITSHHHQSSAHRHMCGTSPAATVRSAISQFLRVVTHFAATRPWMTVVTVTGLSIGMILAGLATNFTVEVDSDILWPPQKSPSALYLKWIAEESNFTLEPYFAILFIHANGDNILGKESVAKSFDVLDSIGELPGYRPVCDQATMGCAGMGVFDFWSEDRMEFETSVQTDQDAIERLSASVFPSGLPVDVNRTFGNPIYDSETGLLIQAQAYRLEFHFPVHDEAMAFLADVTDAMMEICDALEKEGSGLKLEVFTSRSFDDEFKRAIVKDIPLMPMAFILMGIFCCIVFAKWDRVKSQSLLGFGAVVSVLFSILTGYGLMFLCGIPLVTVTQIVFFVIFGIGLDDAFIIHGGYSRTDHNKDPVARVADTIDDVGLSITITTLTSAMAFALGCISSINGIYWLCLYACPTICIVYFYQITFFVALIVIDEERMQENRMDCLVFISVPCPQDSTKAEGRMQEKETHSDNTTTSLSSKAMQWYAHHLLHPVAKGFVVLSFATLFGASVYGMLQLRQEFDFRDLVPSDSYVIDAFDAQDAYSSSTGYDVFAYFRYLNQSDPSVRQEMLHYLEDLEESGAILDIPTYFWVTDFEAFAAKRFGNSSIPFNEQMDAFLEDPIYNYIYKHMIVRDPFTGDVTSSRVLCHMNYDVNSDERMAEVTQLELQHDVAGEQAMNVGRDVGDYRAFLFKNFMTVWEFYTAVPNELIFFTAVGVAAVTVVVVAFIPHWTAVFFVLPSIVTVYVDFLGYLYFVGVPINPVSYVTLVMSIGLLVDFLVHVLVRYYECHGSREERVRETLTTMGSSILVGGITTFLGVMLLSASTSELFHYFFRAFIGLVLLGCAYGLILLPVVLSLVGPEDDDHIKFPAAKGCKQQKLPIATVKSIDTTSEASMSPVAVRRISRPVLLDRCNSSDEISV